MVKSCKVKKRTMRGKNEKDLMDLEQRKDDVVNSNVNNAVNTVNTQENDKNCLVNKTSNNDDGRWWIRLFLRSIYLLFLKERLKLLKI